MIKVYQTRFGGRDAPVAEKGDCFQAAVASIMEIPLREAFDVIPVDMDKDWWNKFNTWLNRYGLGCIAYYASAAKENENFPPIGYHLIEAKSTTLKKGEHHVVVGYNGAVVHDPNSGASKIGRQVYWYVFITLNPAFHPCPECRGTNRIMRSGRSYHCPKCYTKKENR